MATNQLAALLILKKGQSLLASNLHSRINNAADFGRVFWG